MKEGDEGGDVPLGTLPHSLHDLSGNAYGQIKHALSNSK